MNAKVELLKESARIMGTPKVLEWYEKNLAHTPQIETIVRLEGGVVQNQITIRDALSICLIVGVQWNEKFEGTP